MQTAQLIQVSMCQWFLALKKSGQFLYFLVGHLKGLHLVRATAQWDPFQAAFSYGIFDRTGSKKLRSMDLNQHGS